MNIYCMFVSEIDWSNFTVEGSYKTSLGQVSAQTQDIQLLNDLTLLCKIQMYYLY